MGKASRQHRMAVIAGKELPIVKSEKELFRRCLLCRTIIPTHMVIDHVKDCWGETYATEADVPIAPPDSARVFYTKNHFGK